MLLSSRSTLLESSSPSKEVIEDVFEVPHVLRASSLVEPFKLSKDIFGIEALALIIIVFGGTSLSSMASLIVHLPLAGIGKDFVGTE